MKLWIDIEDAAGGRLGPGPIGSMTFLQTTRRLDRAGDWVFEVPATDTRAKELIQQQRRARIYSFINGARTEVGGGFISQITMRMQQDAPPVLRVSGGDMLRELAHISAVNGVAIERTDTPSALLFNARPPHAPATWLISGYLTGQSVSHLFNWESLLEAMLIVTELTGEHFRLDGSDRVLRWLGKVDNFTSSGIRAVTNASPLAAGSNPKVCLINHIERVTDTWELVNRIYPFGGLIPSTDDDLDIDGATKWPDGTSTATNPHTIDGVEYELDNMSKWVQSNDSIDQWTMHARKHVFADIAPDEDEGLTTVAARNQLLAATIERFKTHGSQQEAFYVSVAGLDEVVYPGETISVQARRYIDGERPIDIDEDLIILEAQSEFSSRGVQTDHLMVSTVAQWPLTQERLLAESLI